MSLNKLEQEIMKAIMKRFLQTGFEYGPAAREARRRKLQQKLHTPEMMN